MTESLKRIDELKARIEVHRPLNEGERKALQKWYRVSMTYHSNAIEGSTLSEDETRLIVEDGLTIGGKSVREIKEALNHAELVDKLFSSAAGKTSIDEKLMNQWHQHLLSDIDPANAGKYREISIRVNGSEEVFPLSKEVPGLMDDFYEWLKDARTKKHAVLFAADAHWKFVKVHPYVDGNGRMARLLMNLILLREGLCPVIIPVIRRSEYIAALRKNIEAFESIISEITLENVKDYCRMLEIPLA